MIGEQPISTGRDVQWKPSAMVRVGATVLALDEPVAAALGDLETAADEKMTAGETPEPPKSSKQEPEVPPRSQRGAEAPIARVDKSLVTVSTRSRAPRIKMADVAIIGSALAIIALSIAALVWVLK